MGYDMSIKGELPEPDAEGLATLKEASDSAAAEATRVRTELIRKGVTGFMKVPEYEAAEAAYEAAFNAWRAVKSPDYFRLNNNGMFRYLDAMLNLGMAHESRSPVTGDDWGTLPDYDDGVSAYYEALDKLTGQHPGDNPTIPTFKFGSNDGWWVTPDECHAAVARWDEINIADVNLAEETASIIATDYWGKWIDYLRLAAEHDGFRVH